MDRETYDTVTDAFKLGAQKFQEQKERIEKQNHRIVVLERALLNLAKNVNLGDPEVIKLIYITIAEDELKEEIKWN